MRTVSKSALGLMRIDSLPRANDGVTGTGRDAWSVDVDAPIVGGPANVDGHLFAATRGDNIVALAGQ